jgi:uncharacterized protein (DUF433 family)
MSTTIEIVRTPDVLHGKPRIDGTRVGVFTLGSAVDDGATVPELLDAYPDLDRVEIEAAIEYYRSHPELMDYIRMQKQARRREIAETGPGPDDES